jgi:hypothetical protein
MQYPGVGEERTLWLHDAIAYKRLERVTVVTSGA